MISQSEIHSRINQIWQIFTIAGVTDPITIIESLAYFFLREEFQIGDLSEVSSSRRQLLESQQSTRGGFMPIDLLPDLLNKLPDLRGLPDIKQLVPQFTNSLGIDGYLKIGDAVHELLQDYSSAAQIFNEVLPGFLERMEPGGRYFTPRHLTRWAASLLEILPGARLADFACGSGGFLVATTKKMPQVTGVEISPNWARLAFANCLLHSIKTPDIRIGNSLSIFGKREMETKFDCILMNPPFGAKVDESLVNMAFDYKLSGRSETVLTALAFNHLAELGQMVVFLPSGSLFANSGGEQILREGWIEDGELAAVVTLPQDAFQPYSQVATHALLIEKTQQPGYINWFFQPRFDGFTAGRNRQPDPEHNDLPLVAAAIRTRREARAVIPLSTGGNDLSGYRVLLPDSEARFRVDRLSRLNSIETCILVEFGSDTKKGYYWINQADIQTVDGQSQPIALPTPEKYSREIAATILQGEYALRITDQGGEIRGERKNSYPLQIAPGWEDSAWMGIVLNAKGEPAGPAFMLSEVPNRFKEADDTVFPWDIEIPFDTNGNEVNNTEENSGTLILFPPGQLEGMKLSDHGYLLKSGKHYWLRSDLEKDSLPRFEIFSQENGGSVFESDGRQCGVVFTCEGDALGVAVSSHIIQKTGNLDLQPTSYFPRKHEISEAGSESPAKILADIQKSQLDLADQIRTLLALAEMKSAANESIPPRQVTISPMGELHGIQKDVWDILQTMVEAHGNAFIPGHFRVTDIDTQIRYNRRDDYMKKVDPDLVDGEADLELYAEQDMQNFIDDNSYTEPDLLRVFDLFERMGVLVRVLIDGSEYYRLTSERELLGGNLQ
ncbi:MAG TPA: N-6 DNA methylase [Syntrophomonas sp.]|nr:N-6 DNA methylase [Syntrophomonas sp.]